jgi:hypothetical protein
MTFKDTGGASAEVPPGAAVNGGGTPPEVPPRNERGRGTTNGNARGGSEDRRRRREWLVMTYRANVDAIVIELSDGHHVFIEVDPGTERSQLACRCYRCGVLLTADTVTVDRIIPGCRGGTYRRENIRPACGRCNSVTGAVVRSGS